METSDPYQVQWALLRLDEIAKDLDGINDRRDGLYAERMRLVDSLRRAVPQTELARACHCSVDMIKNVTAKADRQRRAELA